MKKYLYILTIAALCTGCSDSATEAGDESGTGSVRLTAIASAEVEAATRVTVDLPAALIPAAAQFPLRITGSFDDGSGLQNFDQSWVSVEAFDSPLMRRGNYKAIVAFGDPQAEGPAAACFGGEADFAILARRTIDIQLTATLQNAAFRIAFDEWFSKYYSDPQITIRTESGHSFTFTASDDELVFVKPSTRLYMKGTAVKSQTGAAVEFPETQIGTSEPRTRHSITIGASQAGATGLDIRLDDTFTRVEEKLIELNPDADPVE